MEQGNVREQEAGNLGLKKGMVYRNKAVSANK